MKITFKRIAIAIGAAGMLARPALAMANPGGPHHGRRGARMMERFDTDGDGQLSAEELEAAKAARQARHAEMLARFDLDKDGTISDEEREAAHKERAAARFKKLDVNGDGVLTLEEFQAGAFMGRRGRF